MSATARLIETVRVLDGKAPLWEQHLARLRRSAAALGIALEPIAPPSGADRIVRVTVGQGGVGTEDRRIPVTPPLRVVVAAVTHPGYPHKTDQRSAFDAARREAQLHSAGEALLLSRDGWVAEGAFTTLLWWEDGGLAAPPLELGILPSIARERIAGLAGGVREIRVLPGELRGRAIFLANAARGIMEVVSLQGESVPQDPRTAALAARFWP